MRETFLNYQQKKKKKIQSTMLQDRLNYLSVLSTENDISKLLSYEEAIKKYAAKICKKKSITEV